MHPNDQGSQVYSSPNLRRCNAQTLHLRFTQGNTLMPVPSLATSSAIAASASLPPPLVPVPAAHSLAPRWIADRRRYSRSPLNRLLLQLPAAAPDHHARRSAFAAASVYARGPLGSATPFRAPSGVQSSRRRSKRQRALFASARSAHALRVCRRDVERAILCSLLPSPTRHLPSPYVRAFVARHWFHWAVRSNRIDDASRERAASAA